MASATTERERPRRRLLRPSGGVAEGYRVTQRLTWRVAVLSVLVLVVFAALFLRLWALQVLAGTKYVDQAQANSYRTVRVQAPRGRILDRNGRTLVLNQGAQAVQLWTNDLPKVYTRRYAELSRIARVTRVPLYEIAAGIKRRAGDPLTPVVVRDAASKAMVTYLAEHASEFPGVIVGRSYIRQYPYHSLAAQVLGYVGEISASELRSTAKLGGYVAGDEIGQAGVEARYDTYLRGVAGSQRLLAVLR